MTERIKETLRDSAFMRWVVLFMVSGLMFGTYWFQDFYSGLKTLMEAQAGITSTQFSAMVGMTTVANAFGMIMIGGIILDKWGIRLTAIVFGAIAVLGGAISALGASGFFGDDPATMLKYMTIGRVVFGIGLETTCVLINRAVVKWFAGYELALAMAINVGIGRLGTAIGTAISPDIGGSNFSSAVVFAATVLGVGFICILSYLIVDIKIDKQLKKQGKAESGSSEDEKFKMSDLLKLATDKSFMLIAALCVAFYSAVFPFMVYAPDLLINKFKFTLKLPESVPSFTIFGSSTAGDVSIYVVLFIFGLAFPLLPSYIKDKKMKVVALAVTSLLFGLFIFTLKDTLAGWLTNGPKAASMIPMGTILFTPIFGRMVDKKGKAASIMMLGAGLLIFAHLSLSVFNSTLLCYMGLLSLGVAFSLVPAAMWPSVAKIVPEFRLGTAFAAMFTIQNWGLGLFFTGIGTVLDWVNPEVLAKIADTRKTLEAQGLTAAEISEKISELKMTAEGYSYDYTIPILMLVALGIISIFLAFMLKKTSKKQGYNLDEPSIAA